MEAAQVDFQQLRIKHILFKSKVRSVLYGGVFDADFFSPGGPLEHWFKAIGLNRYGQYPEMHDLFQIHLDIIATSLQLIDMYQRGQIDKAHNDLQLMDLKSEQFLAVLSRLDQRLAS
jgi:hypothetical protein